MGRTPILDQLHRTANFEQLEPNFGSFPFPVYNIELPRFAIAVSAATILALVLPSFFTLLVFRPTYIEVKSTKSKKRQHVLQAEASARRWVS